jgi:hypothetical protein
MNTARVAKGALAGAIGGLAGAWVMNRIVHRVDPAAPGATTARLALGAAMGGVYGAFWEVSPATRKMGGASFGTAVWAAADEAAVPLLGLPEPTSDRQARALASRIAFGVTTEIVRRGVRALLA